MNVLEIFDPKSMPFGILSNIALHEIKLDKQKWKSVSNFIYANLLKKSKNSYTHLRLSKNMDIYSNYTKFRKEFLISITKKSLLKALRIKFRNQTFASKLLETGDAKLIYKSPNYYLGNGDGNGLNLFGKMCEIVRSDLQKIKKHVEVEKVDLANIEKIYNLYTIYFVINNLVRNRYDDLNDFKNDTIDQAQQIIDAKYFSLKPQGIDKQDFYKKFENKTMFNKEAQELIEYGLNHPELFLNKIKLLELTWLRDTLLKKRSFLILFYYLQDQLLQAYPEIENISDVANKEISKISKQKLPILLEQITQKYEDGLEFKNQNIEKELKSKLEELDQKIPAESELEDLEYKITSFGNVDEEEEEEEKTDEEKPVPQVPPVLHAPIRRVEAWLKDSSSDSSDGEDNPHPAPRLSVFEHIRTSIKKPEVKKPQVILKPNDEGEIYFEKNSFLSPTDKYPIIVDYLYYPTIAHYYICKVLVNMYPIIVPNTERAHDFILINKKSLHKDPKNYVDLDSHNFESVFNDLDNQSKKILAEKAMDEKFKDKNIVNILLYTGSSKIIYNDFSDKFLGIGKDGQGNNFVGFYLENLRQKKIKKGEKIKSEEKDLKKFLHGKVNKELLDWLTSRSNDMVRSIGIILASNAPVKYKKGMAKFILESLYSPCQSLYDPHITTDINPPVSYQLELSNVFTYSQYLFKIRFGFSQDNPNYYRNLDINNDIISEVWKYISYMIYWLVKKLSKGGHDNIHILLAQMNQDLVVDTKCDLKTTGEENLTNTQKCVILALINIIKIILKNTPNTGPQVVKLNMIKAAASIIDSNMDSQGLAEVPAWEIGDIPVADYFPNLLQLNLSAKMSSINIATLWKIFRYFDKNMLKVIENGQEEKMFLTNRINFFSKSNINIPSPVVEQKSISHSDVEEPYEDLYGDYEGGVSSESEND